MMSENKNQKIESYYDHDDAYPHLKHRPKHHQKENRGNNKDNPSLPSLGEVISPLYGKKLDGADEFKTHMSLPKQNDNENKLTISINDIINQKISDKKVELIKTNIIEEKNLPLDNDKNEQYFRKYDPITKEEVITSTLKTYNKLSEPTAQTMSFLLKPRKNSTNIFGDQTVELKVELEQMKEKIRNPRTHYNPENYEETAMFEGIEEQEEVNDQIRKAVAEAYQIDDNFFDDMPLEERRRLIQHNSAKAGAVRFKTLRNLQENNLNNQFLRRPKPLSQNASGYHKKLLDWRKTNAKPEIKHVKEYHVNRNPYLSRMLEIEEQTAQEAETTRRDRIKTEINSLQKDKNNNK